MIGCHWHLQIVVVVAAKALLLQIVNDYWGYLIFMYHSITSWLIMSSVYTSDTQYVAETYQSFGRDNTNA